MRTLEDILNELLKEKNGTERSEFSDDLDLRGDLGFDSLALAGLTVMLEDEFGIDIFADGYVVTVGDVRQKLGSNV